MTVSRPQFPLRESAECLCDTLTGFLQREDKQEAAVPYVS